MNEAMDTKEARANHPGWVITWLVLIVLGGALAVVSWKEPPPAQRIPAILLDAEKPLRADGAEFQFTLNTPSRVEVAVHLPMDLQGHATFGLPGPAGPRDVAYRPDARDSIRFKIQGHMDEPIEEVLLAVGIYTLRIEPIPVAMGAYPRVHAIVKAWPE